MPKGPHYVLWFFLVQNKPPLYFLFFFSLNDHLLLNHIKRLSPDNITKCAMISTFIVRGSCIKVIQSYLTISNNWIVSSCGSLMIFTELTKLIINPKNKTTISHMVLLHRTLAFMTYNCGLFSSTGTTLLTSNHKYGQVEISKTHIKPGACTFFASFRRVVSIPLCNKTNLLSSH